MTRAARIWIAVGVAIVVIAAVVIGVVVSRDDSSDSASTTTTSSTVTTSASTTSTTGATTSTTKPATSTTSALPPLTDNAQTYAEYLFAAWKLGDRTAAARVANADAVDQMFTQAYSPSVTWTFSSCGPAAGTLYCNWTGSPGGATLTIAVRTTTGGLSTQVVGVTRSS